MSLSKIVDPELAPFDCKTLLFWSNLGSEKYEKLFDRMYQESPQKNFPSVMAQGKTVKLQESEIHTYHRNPRFLHF